MNLVNLFGSLTESTICSSEAELSSTNKVSWVLQISITNFTRRVGDSKPGRSDDIHVNYQLEFNLMQGKVFRQIGLVWQAAYRTMQR